MNFLSYYYVDFIENIRTTICFLVSTQRRLDVDTTLYRRKTTPIFRSVLSGLSREGSAKRNFFLKTIVEFFFHISHVCF